ncbi:MAG: hypothetical protein ACE5FC_01280 [Myxococcota bacterium]
MNSRKTDPRAGNDWRWVVVAGAAIVLGSAIGFFIGGEEGPPSGGEATETIPAATVPTETPAPPADEPAPILARERHVPSPPQPPRADLPLARPAPDAAPPSADNPAVRMAESERRLAAWTQVMRQTRADVRRQLLVGQRQEEVRLRKRIDNLQGLYRNAPDESVRMRLRKLQDELAFLERKIATLETLERSDP